MCNPRRLEVTATRQIHQAWEREVERAAEVTATLTGEARIRQELDASLGGPALMALQTALANGFPGWHEEGDGFRHDVDGGHVIYDPGRRELVIVATLSEELRAQGVARDRLTGTVDDTIEAKGEDCYYSDGWGGQTRTKAQEVARQRAESRLDREAQKRLECEARAAEKERDQALRGEARQAAEQVCERQAGERRAALSRQAQAVLRQVGVRTRQAFHQVLA
ncbi:MAG: hypothetical protein GY856_02565, partial [bacterium]|nr:hypothetical protein [bacterium]